MDYALRALAQCIGFLLVGCAVSTADHPSNSTPSAGGSAGDSAATGGGTASGGATVGSGGGATGGAMATGGSSTGGSATGGSSTGGSSTGGSATGGSATGGAATGGVGTGGSAGRVEPPNGPTGVWTNVTPSEIDMDPNFPYQAANFGAQDVLADPARPQDVYSFYCYQGCWRSQDYGVTWTKADSGTTGNNESLEAGRPWTAAIDPNPNRDPSTSPTMFTVQGYGYYSGIWKSVDWGATWKRLSGPGTGTEDVYSVDIEKNGAAPGALHLIASNHSNNDVYESRDGGATWTTKTSPAGGSCYVFFLNNASTWLAIGARGSNYTYRTTDSGASWTQVAAIGHEHGSTNLAGIGNGIWYASSQGDAGPTGVFKSTNNGASWTQVWNGASNGVTATSKHLYSQYAMAWGAPGSPPWGQYAFPPTGANPFVANLDGTGWTKQTQPNGFGNGAKRFTVTNDGTHDVILSGAWGAGVWRYVEP